MDSPSYLVPVSEDDSVAYYKKIDLNAGENAEEEEPAAESAPKSEGGEEAAGEKPASEGAAAPAAEAAGEGPAAKAEG